MQFMIPPAMQNVDDIVNDLDWNPAIDDKPRKMFMNIRYSPYRGEWTVHFRTPYFLGVQNVLPASLGYRITVQDKLLIIYSHV